MRKYDCHSTFQIPFPGSTCPKGPVKLRRNYERARRGTGLGFLGPPLVELAMGMAE